MRHRILPSLVLAMAALPGHAQPSEPPLKLMVVHRPPYLVVDARGGFGGIAVVPTVAALRKAGIAYEMVQTPALRQLDELKNSKERVCSVGWYKTAEREQFARFSDPLSWDAPWVGVRNAKFAVTTPTTVDAVLGNPDASVLVKVGYVHGDYLDPRLAAMKSKKVLTTGDMPQLMQMLAGGRADITFMPQEEAEYYIQSGPVKITGVSIVRFSDMPAGYPRHLMCNRLVDPQLIKQFNAALSR